MCANCWPTMSRLHPLETSLEAFSEAENKPLASGLSSMAALGRFRSVGDFR
jgi:hypothetical protein